MSNVNISNQVEAAARPDNSWRGVIVVSAALSVIVFAIIALWWQVMPRAPAPVEKYLPLPNGASFIYRVTNADGTVTYRARNVSRGHAAQMIVEMDIGLFTALTHAAGIDLQGTSTQETLLRLNDFDIVRADDVEYDAQGKPIQRMSNWILLLPDRAVVFAAGTVTIEPPLPLVERTPVSDTITGTLSTNAAYTFSRAQESVAALTTAFGELRDCMRVRSVLELNANVTTLVTTYCSGIGEVMEETSESGAPNWKRAEIIAASVGDINKGSAPFVQMNAVNAPMRNVFSETLGTTLQKTFAYEERLDSNGITTQIVPADDVLVYGTASGAVVALDRAARRERWRFQSGGAVYSTPLVMNGVVYFGAADKKVYAVRLDNGALVWTFQTQDIVSATPALSENTVLVASEDKRLYALDTDTGEPRWVFAAGGVMLASPVVQDTTAYVSNAIGTLTALDTVTGETRWQFSAERAIAAPVTIDGERIYVTSYDGKVYALARADGAVLWRTNLNDTIETPAVAANGRVYVAMPTELFALDAGNGNIVWRYRDAHALRGAPVVWGDQLWQLTQQDLIGVNAASGTPTARLHVADASPNAGLSSDGRALFAGFFNGALVGLEASAP